jgi:hypothetical protein
MKCCRSAVLAVACMVLAVPAMAHHSFNTFFDMSRTIKIDGVVTSFKLVNPHSEMLIDVPGADGKAVTPTWPRFGASWMQQLAWRMP